MAFFEKIKAGAHGVYKNVAESVMPTLKESKFLSDGVLTPAEFVAAGDLLVHKCPTWTWEAAEEGKGVPYLPNDKQFLLTRNVPCLMRLKTYEGQMSTDSKTVTEGEEEWCAPTYANQAESQSANMPSSSSSPSSSAASTSTSTATANATTSNTGSTAKDDDDSEDIPDMEEFDDAGNLGEAEDRAALKTAPAPAAVAPAAAAATATQTSSAVVAVNDNIKRTRTYDIGITYDKYYQTPKLWLFGYDENRQPLRAEQMFEDIASDYSQKTVTIENFPHKTAHWAFIHPCRHAEVMKRLVERQLANNKTPRPDQYLFLFLKFISAVIPCIEYDNTNNVEL